MDAAEDRGPNAVRHLMLDLETLDTCATAKILSIGAMWFDPYGDAVPARDDADASFYVVIDARSYTPADGFTDSRATRAWWKRQERAARDEVFDNPKAVPWRTALVQFTAWLQPPAKYMVWANSPSFDCAILQHALHAANHPVPWAYYAQRDVRTLGSISGYHYAVMRKQWVRRDPATAVVHNALADCQLQVRFVQHCLRALSVSKAEASGACVLYTGPMYAGKTDALIAHLQYLRDKFKGARAVLVVKHVNDVIRNKDELRSRSGAVWQGSPVHTLASLDELLKPPLLAKLHAASVVVLDEAHFFAPAELRAFVRMCTAKQQRLILSGLSARSDATPWPALAVVQPFVTRTVHLCADCTRCGGVQTATLTHRRTPMPADGDPVYVASHRQEDAVYRPVCASCYDDLLVDEDARGTAPDMDVEQ